MGSLESAVNYASDSPNFYVWQEVWEGTFFEMETEDKTISFEALLEIFTFFETDLNDETRL